MDKKVLKNWSLVQNFVEGTAFGKLHDEEDVRQLGRRAEQLDDVGVVDPVAGFINFNRGTLAEGKGSIPLTSLN